MFKINFIVVIQISVIQFVNRPKVLNSKSKLNNKLKIKNHKLNIHNKSISKKFNSKDKKVNDNNQELNIDNLNIKNLQKGIVKESLYNQKIDPFTDTTQIYDNPSFLTQKNQFGDVDLCKQKKEDLSDNKIWFGGQHMETQELLQCCTAVNNPMTAIALNDDSHIEGLRAFRASPNWLNNNMKDLPKSYSECSRGNFINIFYKMDQCKFKNDIKEFNVAFCAQNDPRDHKIKLKFKSCIKKGTCFDIPDETKEEIVVKSKSIPDAPEVIEDKFENKVINIVNNYGGCNSSQTNQEIFKVKEEEKCDAKQKLKDQDKKVQEVVKNAIKNDWQQKTDNNEQSVTYVAEYYSNKQKYEEELKKNGDNNTMGLEIKNKLAMEESIDKNKDNIKEQKEFEGV